MLCGETKKGAGQPARVRGEKMHGYFTMCLVDGLVGMGWDHPHFEDRNLGWSSFQLLFGSEEQGRGLDELQSA
jgi:hypothetical protein